MKYHVCIKDLQGMNNEERCPLKSNLNKTKKKTVKIVKKHHAPNIALRRYMMTSIVIYVTNDK